MSVGAAQPSRTRPPTCFGQSTTIVGAGTINGTPGDDVIVGSPGDDVIDGQGGGNLICALEGDDVVQGGPGNDSVTEARVATS